MCVCGMLQVLAGTAAVLLATGSSSPRLAIHHCGLPAIPFLRTGCVYVCSSSTWCPDASHCLVAPAACICWGQLGRPRTVPAEASLALLEAIEQLWERCLALHALMWPSSCSILPQAPAAAALAIGHTKEVWYMLHFRVQVPWWWFCKNKQARHGLTHMPS